MYVLLMLHNNFYVSLRGYCKVADIGFFRPNYRQMGQYTATLHKSFDIPFQEFWGMLSWSLMVELNYMHANNNISQRWNVKTVLSLELRGESI